MEKTQAQSLLEKLTGNLKDSVTLNVAGVDFTFIRDNAAYDQMLNDIESNNKVTPIKDCAHSLPNSQSCKRLVG